MNIDITRLKHGLVEYIDIDKIIDMSDINLDGTEIIELKEVKIKGSIVKNNLDSYVLNVKISGTMILPCSITLEPVDYKFETEINGIIEEMLEEIDEISKKSENTIDIFPIIWENILMEIPIKVISPSANTEKLFGDGWRLVTNEKETGNRNAFDKLKDLL